MFADKQDAQHQVAQTAFLSCVQQTPEIFVDMATWLGSNADAWTHGIGCLASVAENMGVEMSDEIVNTDAFDAIIAECVSMACIAMWSLMQADITGEDAVEEAYSIGVFNMVRRIKEVWSSN